VGEIFFDIGGLAGADADTDGEGAGELAANAPVMREAKRTEVRLRKRRWIMWIGEV
jgi:hypothetical protein